MLCTFKAFELSKTYPEMEFHLNPIIVAKHWASVGWFSGP